MKYDLTGQRFGKLTVVCKTTKDTTLQNKDKGIYWLCQCDCGEQHKATTYNLRKGTVKSCGCLKPGSRAKDLTGRKFGKLTVLSRGDTPDTSLTGIYVFWNCVCECGNTITTRGSALNNGSTQSCGCKNKEQVSKRHWRGHNGLSLTYFHKIQNSANHRGIPFDITMEEAWNKFVKQEHKCALSGVDLVMLGRGTGLNKFNHRHTASLDRINSDYGYTTDNVQWVHKTVNRMKGSLSDGDLLEWAKKIVENHA